LRFFTTNPLALAAILTLTPFAALGGESAYSKLDFDKHCTFEKPSDDENAGPGASAICQIGNFPTIYFDEGDLRQSVGFGAPKEYQTFGQFNYINNVIEWRSKNGKPYAAIVRFFIQNSHLDNDDGDKANLGQVLVVHRVAENKNGQTCIVGMVDARANANANVLARQIADKLAASFNCTTDKAEYLGIKSKFAGGAMF